MPSSRVHGAAPATGRLLLFLALLVMSQGCSRDPGHLATFEVPANSDPRKELIVRGVRMTGRIEARFEHGRTTLNGIELQRPPMPRGVFSPFDPYDTTAITVREERVPSRKEIATVMRRLGLDRVNTIRKILGINAPVLVICTYNSDSVYPGNEATRRFSDLDRLRRAGTPDARRRILPSTLLIPKQLDELETAGYFETNK